MASRPVDLAEQGTPSRPDPVRRAAHVVLLVLVSPAMLLVLVVGGVLVLAHMAIRLSSRVLGLASGRGWTPVAGDGAALIARPESSGPARG